MSNCQSQCFYKVHLLLKYFMCILILVINSTKPRCQWLPWLPYRKQVLTTFSVVVVGGVRKSPGKSNICGSKELYSYRYIYMCECLLLWNLICILVLSNKTMAYHNYRWQGLRTKEYCWAGGDGTRNEISFPLKCPFGFLGP